MLPGPVLPRLYAGAVSCSFPAAVEAGSPTPHTHHTAPANTGAITIAASLLIMSLSFHLLIVMSYVFPSWFPSLPQILPSALKQAMTSSRIIQDVNGRTTSFFPCPDGFNISERHYKDNFFRRIMNITSIIDGSEPMNLYQL